VGVQPLPLHTVRIADDGFHTCHRQEWTGLQLLETLSRLEWEEVELCQDVGPEALGKELGPEQMAVGPEDSQRDWPLN